jgi:hypothetical protein
METSKLFEAAIREAIDFSKYDEEYSKYENDPRYSDTMSKDRYWDEDDDSEDITPNDEVDGSIIYGFHKDVGERGRVNLHKRPAEMPPDGSLIVDSHWQTGVIGSDFKIAKTLTDRSSNLAKSGSVEYALTFLVDDKAWTIMNPKKGEADGKRWIVEHPEVSAYQANWAYPMCTLVKIDPSTIKVRKRNSSKGNVAAITKAIDAWIEDMDGSDSLYYIREEHYGDDEYGNDEDVDGGIAEVKNDLRDELHGMFPGMESAIDQLLDSSEVEEKLSELYFNQPSPNNFSDDYDD